MEAANVPVYVSELVIGEEDWVLPGSERVLRLRARAGQILWYKENLLNLLERIVPAEFDRLAWVDADVWFERTDWFKATELALDRFPVVQMCDKVVITNEDGTVGKIERTSAAVGFLRGGIHPGMAWAAWRTLWTEGGGLYERSIVGDGDVINASAWLPGAGNLKWTGCSDLPDGIQRLRKWATKSGKCGCVAGTLWHEWHGNYEKRYYTARRNYLKGLDVQRHLCKQGDGLLTWTVDAPADVISMVASYFARREEDEEQPVRNPLPAISKTGGLSRVPA